MRLASLLLLAGCALAGTTASPDPSRPFAPALTEEQAVAIGRRIWNREAGGGVAHLVWWSPNEDFASLGICHAIWYPPPDPAGPAQTAHEEMFPSLAAYMREHGTPLPSWLGEACPRCAPWPDRRAFQLDFESERMRALKQLFADNISVQAHWAIDRMAASVPAVVDGRGELRERLDRVAAEGAMGVYALVDYVNVKGTGVSGNERYPSPSGQPQGWGLRQVLEEMADTPPGRPALEEFARAAEAVLRRRVDNARRLSPPRDEAHWLPAWTQRVRGYLAG